jgi:hypothetical protein
MKPVLEEATSSARTSVTWSLLKYQGSRPGHFNRLRTGEARQTSRRACLPPPLFPALTLGTELLGRDGNFRGYWIMAMVPRW